MKYTFITILAVPLFFLMGCRNEELPVDKQFLNLSDDFAVCNRNLDAYVNGNGDYCLFGYKWGTGNPFFNRGNNVIVNTHAQVNLPALSFASLPGYARDQIRKALQDWGAVAAISFNEFPDSSETDIRFFEADIRQSDIGYPNFPDDTCLRLGGNMIIKNNVSIRVCRQFYLFVLHEIGHVLELGHVNAYNIMNPETIRSGIEELQEGDIKGITEIYGVE